MIVFDLDGTLANCEHRRHFVDPSKNKKYVNKPDPFDFTDPHTSYIDRWFNIETGMQDWKPDWKAFYQACDKDTIIEPTREIFYQIWDKYLWDVKIWSGRCESVRRQTEEWLTSYGLPVGSYLKMRPIGDNTPDDILKERWLDEAIAEGKKIDFVFDDRPKVIRMWRRRGIFVFDCNQSGEEF